MAQITSITSESLQAQIRQLLPSQQGFGEDLQATNVITPVIDLTAAAQGTTTPEFMQRAINFGGATVFNVINTTTTVINTAGFYQVTGQTNLSLSTASAVFVAMFLNDGATDKQIYGLSKNVSTSYSEYFGESFNFVIFLRSADIFKIQASANAQGVGSFRQVADVNGNLVNPTGFTPQ